MNIQIAKERFIKKSKHKYGDNVFDYSLVTYVNHKTPVKLKCIKCGCIFEQTPYKHLHIDRKHSCPNCIKEIKRLQGQNRFITECSKKFNNKFDYSKVYYVNPFTPVEVICPIHGSFYTVPNDHQHSLKTGCPQCTKDERNKKQ